MDDPTHPTIGEGSSSLQPTRILVYGVTGSGKTTLAERISRATGIPWYAIDDLTWDPNWTEVPTEEQRVRVTRICDSNEWIIDSAYAKWIDLPLARVQLIVGLDYPGWLSFFRLLRRSFARALDKKPICNGNRESFSLMFSRDSILLWHWKSFRRKSDSMRRWANAADFEPEVMLFNSPRQTDRWLNALGQQRGRSI